MKDDCIRSSRPYFPKEDIDSLLNDIREVLEEGRFRNGKNLVKFEQMFANYIGVKHAVAFDSDGDALETALRYYGVQDREVVVCTNSFISIPNSVVYAGGHVVFADIKPGTLSMDPESLKNFITEKTCGVIVTHIAGFPNPDLEEICEICKDKSLFLVEDATHAAGATFEGRKVGTFGRAAVFAFTPTKVLTTGEGGMLVANEEDLVDEAKRFRYYGSGRGKTSFATLGRHMMLPEVSAILGIYQLNRVEEFVEKRNEIARFYNEEFSKLETVETVACAQGSRCSYYKYPLILDSRVERAAFTDLLGKEYGIETGNVFYPPCHMQPAYSEKVRESLVVSEKALAQTITLPMHVAISKSQADCVAQSVVSVLETTCRRA